MRSVIERDRVRDVGASQRCQQQRQGQQRQWQQHQQQHIDFTFPPLCRLTSVAAIATAVFLPHIHMWHALVAAAARATLTRPRVRAVAMFHVHVCGK